MGVADDARWNPATKVLFRFAAAYFVLVLLPFPLFPIGAVYEEGWKAAVTWFSRRALGLELTVFPNGSGDTTFNYILVLVHACLSVAATLAWTAMDAARPNYRRAHVWLRTYLRFALAAILFSYGAAKVFKGQFPDPPPNRLVETLGEMSPMGLLWTFMGVSQTYTVFGGLAETLPAVLLVFGQTTLLGALLAAGVLTNVVILNFSYDVPVKIYSLHLLAVSLFLVAPDAPRLFDFFVGNRAVSTWPRPSAKSRVERAATVAGIAGMALFALQAFVAAHQGRRSEGDPTPPSLQGLWTTDDFQTDGIPSAPVRDDIRWRYVTFPFPGTLTVHLMNGKVRWYQVRIDEQRHHLDLINRGDRAHVSLSYAENDGRLTLTGDANGHNIEARLRRTPLSEVPLMNRGFHWVNEYPFNR